MTQKRTNRSSFVINKILSLLMITFSFTGTAHATLGLCPNGFPKLVTIPPESRTGYDLHWQSRKVMFSTDESRMVVLNEEKRLKIYKTRNWKKTFDIITSDNISAAVTDNQKSLLGVGLVSGKVLVYDLTSHHLMFSFKQTGVIESLSFSPSGEFLVISSRPSPLEEAKVDIYDLKSNAKLFSNQEISTRLDLSSQKNPYVFSADEKFLYISIYHAKAPGIFIFDLTAKTKSYFEFPKISNVHDWIEQIWLQRETGHLIAHIHHTGWSTLMVYDPIAKSSREVYRTSEFLRTSQYSIFEPTKHWVMFKKAENNTEYMVLKQIDLTSGAELKTVALPKHSHTGDIHESSVFSILGGGSAALFQNGFAYDLDRQSEIGFIFNRPALIFGRSPNGSFIAGGDRWSDDVVVLNSSCL